MVNDILIKNFATSNKKNFRFLVAISENLKIIIKFVHGNRPQKPGYGNAGGFRHYGKRLLTLDS